MTSKGHERREEEEEERNSWGLEFTWTSLSPCYTVIVIVFVSSFFFSKEQQFALHVQMNSVCSVLALPCIVQEMGGWGWGGCFIMSRERVMVCAGHLLVISRSAHPGVLFNK